MLGYLHSLIHAACYTACNIHDRNFEYYDYLTCKVLRELCQVVCRVYKPKATVAQNKRVVWAYDHSVTVGVLPVSMFANGHIFFVQKLYEVCDVTHFLCIVFRPLMHCCCVTTIKQLTVGFC